MFTFGPASRGGIDPRISLLLRANTANGSTPLDESSYGLVPTGNIGIVQAASAKYGAAGMLFNGGPQKYLDYAWTAGGPFDFGAGDFTIECWVKPAANTGDQQVLFHSAKSPFAASDFAVECTFYTGALGGMVVYVGGTSYAIAGSMNLGVGTWYHCAYVRQGQVLRQYRDGVEQANQTHAGMGSINSIVGGACRIGARANSSSSRIVSGSIDDYRITKGVCLYPGGTTFTPPLAL